jgi:hypothetical protein
MIMQGKEHVPTEENRRMVEMLAFGKSTQTAIAAALGINDKTLREHYSFELAAKKAEIKSNLLYTALWPEQAEGIGQKPTRV